jgi:hypothetical protein
MGMNWPTSTRDGRSLKVTVAEVRVLKRESRVVRRVSFIVVGWSEGVVEFGDCRVEMVCIVLFRYDVAAVGEYI